MNMISSSPSRTSPRKRLFIKTFGCQMNFYDSERMEDVLRPLGFETIESPEGADMIILNTCHIREKATEKVYSDLGRLKSVKTSAQQNGKDVIIAVAGCVAQAEGEEIRKRAPYVDMVFGPQTYHRLPEMIAKATRSLADTKTAFRGVLDTDFPEISKFDSLPTPRSEGPTAFLSIQEGCDKFCHFCCVPYTRGAEYSRPGEQILEEAQSFVDQGVKEITVLGQNVNAYHGIGSDKVTWGLGRLLRELAKIQGLERLRYTTSHPRDMDKDLIEAHRDIPEIMPFLHLPVQSGSDRMLKAMNRKHTVEDYLGHINHLIEACPTMAFSSDFIVGYPGETDKDFEDTLELVKNVKFAQAFSFKYSRRPGTPAAALSTQVPETVKSERLKVLQDLLREQQIAFNQQSIGSIQPVLFENQSRKESQLVGRTPYMQLVHVPANKRLLGHSSLVKITTAGLTSLGGEMVIQD